MDFNTESSEKGGYTPFNTGLDKQYPVGSIKLDEQSRKLVVEGKMNLYNGCRYL